MRHAVLPAKEFVMPRARKSSPAETEQEVRSDLPPLPEAQSAEDAADPFEVDPAAPLGAAPVDFFKTPQFQRAVAEETAKQLAALQGKNAAVPGEAPEMGIFRNLALAIAEISDQGTDRKRVAPEILAARAKAHASMIVEIMAMRERVAQGVEGALPIYALVAKVYINEVVVDPYCVDGFTHQTVQTRIFWDSVPNPAMRPENEAAKRIHDLYLASIGSTGLDVPISPVWTTGKGRIITSDGGGAPQSRKTINNPDDVRPQVGAALTDFNNRFGVVGSVDPTKETINVLGTIAPAARRAEVGGVFKQGPRVI